MKLENIKIDSQLKRFVYQNVLAMVGLSAYVLADTFFISVAGGTNGITALNLCLPAYNIMNAIAAMIGIGHATLYSIYRAEEREGYDKLFFNAIAFELICSVFFVLIGIFGSEAILRLEGADKAIIEIGKPYLTVAFCFGPMFMTHYACTSFVRNDGDSEIAMASTLFSSLFNIIFDYILVFPCGLGVFGAALATGLSPIVGISICCIHFFGKRNSHIRFIPGKLDFKTLFRGCKLGTAAFVAEISGGITIIAFNYSIMAIAGNVGVAAYGVIANIAIVASAIFNGVSTGLQPLASEAYGRGDSTRKKLLLEQSIMIGLTLAVIQIVLVFIFAPVLVSIFNSAGSRELARMSEPGLRIYFIGFIFAALNMIRASYFSATGRARESSLIAILRGLILIVLFALILPRFAGMLGVWLAFGAAELTTYLITARFRADEKSKPMEE